MYLKYDNMHTNRIFNALNCINDHVNSCKNCMLSMAPICAHALMMIGWTRVQPMNVS